MGQRCGRRYALGTQEESVALLDWRACRHALREGHGLEARGGEKPGERSEQGLTDVHLAKGVAKPTESVAPCRAFEQSLEEQMGV